jgi:hypothetical protein
MDGCKLKEYAQSNWLTMWGFVCNVDIDRAHCRIDDAPIVLRNVKDNIVARLLM